MTTRMTRLLIFAAPLVLLGACTTLSAEDRVLLEQTRAAAQEAKDAADRAANAATAAERNSAASAAEAKAAAERADRMFQRTQRKGAGT